MKFWCLFFLWYTPFSPPNCEQFKQPFALGVCFSRHTPAVSFSHPILSPPFFPRTKSLCFRNGPLSCKKSSTLHVCCSLLLPNLIVRDESRVLNSLSLSLSLFFSLLMLCAREVLLLTSFPFFLSFCLCQYCCRRHFRSVQKPFII